MSSYCLKCRKNTESINPRVSKSNNSITTIWSKVVMWDSKKSRFSKKQESIGILSNLDIKAPLDKVPLIGYILFWCFECIKINEIVNK